MKMVAIVAHKAYADTECVEVSFLSNGLALLCENPIDQAADESGRVLLQSAKMAVHLPQHPIHTYFFQIGTYRFRNCLSSININLD